MRPLKRLWILLTTPKIFHKAATSTRQTTVLAVGIVALCVMVIYRLAKWLAKYSDQPEEP